MILSADQERGIARAKDWALNQSSFTFYLAGYAGTGKTTIAKLLAEHAEDVVFAAYTGRAALQLSRKTGRPAFTLHSLLYKPRTVRGRLEFVFVPEESVLQDVSYLVIDEASMVPSHMEQELLHFPNLRILLIGDPAQLPPPMKCGGLIAGRQPDVMLTEIHRQALESPVLRLATSVREGKGLAFGKYGNSCVMNARDPVKVAVESKASMVLAGMKKTVRKLNLAFRKGDDSLPKVGEPLLALQNMHDDGIMNGSLWKLESARPFCLGEDLEGGAGRGGLVSADDQNNPLRYRFRVNLSAEPDQTRSDIDVDFSPAMGQEYDYRKGVCPMDFGNCLTVHKAQGSEWPEVCIINESGVFRDAARAWLYTALTRAAKDVLVLNGKV